MKMIVVIGLLLRKCQSQIKEKFGVLEFLEQTTNLAITTLLKQIQQILVLYLVYIKMLLSIFIMIVTRQIIDVRTNLEL